jgi:four helix bundle protein
MKSYRDLEAWKLGIALTKSIYELTRTFPKEEMQGLRTQMQKAAISIPSHVAEGFLQSTGNEFLRFLALAQECLAELDTLLASAVERQYCPSEVATKVRQACDAISREVAGLKKHLESKQEGSAGCAGPESCDPNSTPQ